MNHKITISFTKEQIEGSRAITWLDIRHRLLRRVVEATVEDQPHWELLRAIEMIAGKIKEFGYKGRYLDVAAYAEALFQQEDDIP